MPDKGTPADTATAASAAATGAAAPAAGAKEGTPAPVVPITREPTRDELFAPVTDVRSAVDAMEKEAPDAFDGLARRNDDHLSEMSGINDLPDPTHDDDEESEGASDDGESEGASDDEKEDKAKPAQEDKPKKDEDDESEVLSKVAKERAALSARQVRMRHRELRLKTQEAEVKTGLEKIAARAAELDAREKELAASAPATLPTDGMAAIAELAARTNTNPRALLRSIIKRVAAEEPFPTVESVKQSATKSQDLGPAEEMVKTLTERIDKLAQELNAEREMKKKSDELEVAERRVRDWESKGIESLKVESAEYPLLAKELEKGREDVIRAEMVDVANRYIANTDGLVPSQEDVLAYLEQGRAETFEAWTGRPHASGDAPGSDNAETAPGTAGTSETQQKPSPKAPRTTTNHHAAEQGTPAPEKMTERERIAFAAEAVPKDFAGWAHAE